MKKTCGIVYCCMYIVYLCHEDGDEQLLKVVASKQEMS